MSTEMENEKLLENGGFFMNRYGLLNPEHQTCTWPLILKGFPKSRNKNSGFRTLVFRYYFAPYLKNERGTNKITKLKKVQKYRTMYLKSKQTKTTIPHLIIANRLKIEQL